MSKKSLRGVKVLGALALILIAVGAFITRQQLVALPAEAFGVLDKTDPSGIRYWSALGSGGKDAHIGVRYDYESRAGVEAYIAWNKSEAVRLLNAGTRAFWVIVNFNGPQPRAAFEQFVKDYDVTVINYTMRAGEPPTPLMPEGNRVTATGGPDHGILILDDLFNRMYSSVVDERGTVRGRVDREGFQKLQSDPRVAVVEVFETLGRQAFLDNRDKLTAADPRLLQAVDADEPYLRIQLDGPPLY